MTLPRDIEKVLRLKEELQSAGFELRINSEYLSVVKNENQEGMMIYFSAKTVGELSAYMRGISDGYRKHSLTVSEWRKVEKWV